jgi:hypothetical protein
MPDNSLHNMMIHSKTNHRLPITDNHCAPGTISTTVESALQNHLFMQNEPNFRKSQMNVNNVLTREYEKKDTWCSGKKQSQTNPNKAKFKKAKMNVTSILIKGYENKPPIRAPKKQSQFSKRQKTMQTSLPQRIMKETRFWVRTKQSQYKPKQSQFPSKKMLLSTFLLWDVVPRSLCCLRIYMENVG